MKSNSLADLPLSNSMCNFCPNPSSCEVIDDNLDNQIGMSKLMQRCIHEHLNKTGDQLEC